MGFAVFVTGTDTEVGKTVVAGGLALAFRKRGIDVGVMKPAVTGCRTRGGKRAAEDVDFLVKASGSEDNPQLVCPYMLRDPLAPEVAAEREGVRIDIRTIKSAFRRLSKKHEALIIEGAGGLFVPIKRNYLMIDLIAAIGVPIVIVARPGLGTINHTLLSCQAARAKNIGIAGIIINNYPPKPSTAERTNPDMIRRYARAPLLGVVPHLPAVSVENCSLDGLLKATESSIDIKKLLSRFRRMNT
jgi:dethiobiotin synthetase